MCEPNFVGTPLVSARSFTENGTPWIGPSGSPLMTACSARRAAASAASAVTVQKAFSVGFSRSMRSSTTRVSSTGDSLRARMSPVSSVADVKARSEALTVAGSAPPARGADGLFEARVASWSREPLALVGQAGEQRRRRPERVAGRLLEGEHRVAHRAQPDLVGPEHRATSVDRPAVSVHPDDIDVAGPDGDLLLQDLGALVYHRVEQALEDLLVGDVTPGDALRRRHVDDDLLHLGVGDRRAVTLL